MIKERLCIENINIYKMLIFDWEKDTVEKLKTIYSDMKGTDKDVRALYDADGNMQRLIVTNQEYRKDENYKPLFLFNSNNIIRDNVKSFNDAKLYYKFDGYYYCSKNNLLRYIQLSDSMVYSRKVYEWSEHTVFPYFDNYYIDDYYVNKEKTEKELLMDAVRHSSNAHLSDTELKNMADFFITKQIIKGEKEDKIKCNFIKKSKFEKEYTDVTDCFDFAKYSENLYTAKI